MDVSLFFKITPLSRTFLLIYVDDILVLSSSSSDVLRTITLLQQVFAIRDLGPAHYFLGIELRPHLQCTILSQEKYVRQLLRRTNMVNYKPTANPCHLGTTNLSHNGSNDVTLYRSVVGALQYLTLTRPDIAFAVNRASQHMHQPTYHHWLDVKHLLRYLHAMSIGQAAPLIEDPLADSLYSSKIVSSHVAPRNNLTLLAPAPRPSARPLPTRPQNSSGSSPCSPNFNFLVLQPPSGTIIWG